MPDATESSGSVARRTEAALANVNPKPFSHQGFALRSRVGLFPSSYFVFSQLEDGCLLAVSRVFYQCLRFLFQDELNLLAYECL